MIKQHNRNGWNSIKILITYSNTGNEKNLQKTYKIQLHILKLLPKPNSDIVSTLKGLKINILEKHFTKSQI